MINRRKLLENAVLECLDEMYIRSQPSITFNELQMLYKSNPNSNEILPSHYYLCKEEYDDILESYIRAYRIHNEFHEDVELVKDYLTNGGTKDKYIEEDGKPPYRGYEKVPPLKDFIGEDHANKALELIEECNKFYRPDREENGFRFEISNYGPSQCLEAVREYWGDREKIYERKFNDDTEEYENVMD